MTEDMKRQLRLMLASQRVNDTPGQLETIYEWVVGKESKIVAVTETGVVK